MSMVLQAVNKTCVPLLQGSAPPLMCKRPPAWVASSCYSILITIIRVHVLHKTKMPASQDAINSALGSLPDDFTWHGLKLPIEAAERFGSRFVEAIEHRDAAP